MKNSYCSYCGIKFNSIEFPINCNCGNITYINPIPIITILVPVYLKSKQGLLIQKRAISPCLGEWCLPGGYINAFETYQQAAKRELFEECNINLPIENFILYDVTSAHNGNILIFARYKFQIDFEEVEFIKNSEVEDINIFTGGNLCFPTHKLMANKYLDIYENKR